MCLPRRTSLLATLLVLGCATAQNRPDPEAFINGKSVMIEESNFPKHYARFPPNDKIQHKSDVLSYYVLNEEKKVLYVPNFVNETVAHDIQLFCIEGKRFTQSPIRGTTDDGSSVEKHDYRTSESCPLVPAAAYMSNPRFQDMLEQDPLPPQVARVAREVDISWDIAVRSSELLGVNPHLVEALQVVRYTSPDAEYKLHHDHGGYYGKSSEHRSFTMLIFLNDVENAGGHTSFPKLDLEVVPRGGDALIWSNTIDSKVDKDMVHAGKPPSKAGVEKYAVNVWFGEESFENRVKEGQTWS